MLDLPASSPKPVGRQETVSQPRGGLLYPHLVGWDPSLQVLEDFRGVWRWSNL